MRERTEGAMLQVHKKYTMIGGAFVLLFTFAAFITSVAPTVAFWDCGEYVGSSYSLGIPHPPGNPLYVLLGRVFSILFSFFDQVAYRVNLISVFSGCATAVFIYLIVVRSMVSWMGLPDTTWKRITVYLSGIVGAFFCAFGYTFWFSSVEASVYVPSMLFVAMCTWLVIKWADSKEPDRDRYLILLAYLAFLGIGIHMFSAIALLPVFLFVMISDEEKLHDWRLWFSAILLASVIYHVTAFLYMAPLVFLMAAIYALFRTSDARYINAAAFGFILAVKSVVEFGHVAQKEIMFGTFLSRILPFAVFFAVAVVEFVAGQAAWPVLRKKWRFVMWLALFSVVGYSVHIYIPIRSALKPIIDENHPVIEWRSGKVEWAAFKGFLERKQYGSESMVTRMLHRRGAWNKQLGIDGHMGWGGFHLTQFFHFGRSVGEDRERSVFENWGFGGGLLRLLLYLLPTAFMLFGWWYLYQRNRNTAILLMFLFLLTSIGLVLYMNFADGFHAEGRDYRMWVGNGRQGPMPTVHREVRIRDYFFTPGFMFYGMWIGLAAGCLLQFLFTNRNRFLRTQLAPILVVLFAISPALPFTQNIRENSRGRDWVPYDYAYNLLMSCEKDGILFTNGDNDTFPLWFLQEAEGIRRDVRIVNLSLVNTKWYIKQLKELEPTVPVSFSVKEIEEKLNHQLNPLNKSIDYRMPNAGIVVRLPGRDEMRALRVQDQMVVNIVDSNRWKKPVYFAVTVSNDNMMGLQPYLQMQGLVYRVMRRRASGDERVDLARTLYLLDKVYHYRSLGDASAPLSETSRKLMSNYAASFIQVGLSLRGPLARLKDEVSGLEKAHQDSGAKWDVDAGARLSKIRTAYEDTLALAINKLDQCVAVMPWDWRPRLLRQEVLMSHERWEEALVRIKQAREVEPGNTEYLKLEAQVQGALGNKAEANAILREVVEKDEDPWDGYLSLARNYEELGLFDSGIAMMEEYGQIRPGDRRAAHMIRQLNARKREKTNAVLGVDSPAQSGDTGEVG